MIYQAKGLPITQNRMYPTRESARACPVGDVRLEQDERTGLISNAAHRLSSAYDENYQNDQSSSDVFAEHLDEVARRLSERYRGRRAMEIGCGKGHFLTRLRSRGVYASGMDPAYEGDDPAVVKTFFAPGVPVPADLVVLRHVLEHVTDPPAFLSAVRDSAPGADVYIEVPCFDWILGQRAWYDIHYEHIHYFRSDDLRRMFGAVRESGRCFGGQYLYLTAGLSGLRVPGPSAPVEVPAGFQDAAASCAELLRGLPGRKAVWGCASKGVLFALFMQRAGIAIDALVDIDPVKHGKYVPVSGLRCGSPESELAGWAEGDVIIVVNPNYLEEVRRRAGGRYRYLVLGPEGLKEARR